MLFVILNNLKMLLLIALNYKVYKLFNNNDINNFRNNKFYVRCNLTVRSSKICKDCKACSILFFLFEKILLTQI